MNETIANITNNISTNITNVIPQGMSLSDQIAGYGYGGIAGFFFILPICYALIGRDAYRSKFFWGFYALFASVFSAVFNYYEAIAKPMDCLIFLILGTVMAILVYLIKRKLST